MHRGAPVRTGHKRSFWNCQAPFWLTLVVAAYWIFTLTMIGDGALKGRNPAASISPSSFSMQQHRKHDAKRWVRNLQRPHPTEAPPGPTPAPTPDPRAHPVGNAVADILLLLFPDSSFWSAVHALPDSLTAVVLGALTLASLQIVQLCDPGEIPRSWGENALERKAQERAAAAAGATGAGAGVGGGGGGGGGGSSVIDMSSATTNQSKTSPITPAAAAATASLGSPASASSPAVIEEGMGSPVASPATMGTVSQPPVDERPAPGWTFCDKCDLWRPPRGHHERVTNRCIHRVDHFCMWVNGVVAHRTHKCFLLFLFYILGCIGHYFFMVVRFFFAESLLEWLNNTSSMGPSLIMLGYTVFVIPTGLLALSFFWMNVFIMAQDETTLEQNIRRAPRRGGMPLVRRAPTDSDEDVASVAMKGPGSAMNGGSGGAAAQPPPAAAAAKKSCLKRWLYWKPRRWYKNFCSFMGPPYMWLVPQPMPLENPLEAEVVSNKTRNRDV